MKNMLIIGGKYPSSGKVYPETTKKVSLNILNTEKVTCKINNFFFLRELVQS